MVNYYEEELLVYEHPNPYGPTFTIGLFTNKARALEMATLIKKEGTKISHGGDATGILCNRDDGNSSGFRSFLVACGKGDKDAKENRG